MTVHYISRVEVHGHLEFWGTLTVTWKCILPFPKLFCFPSYFIVFNHLSVELAHILRDVLFWSFLVDHVVPVPVPSSRLMPEGTVHSTFPSLCVQCAAVITVTILVRHSGLPNCIVWPEIINYFNCILNRVCQQHDIFSIVSKRISSSWEKI